ncbi:MAG: hypothetical protein IPH12_06770 [Saprospirales bacterium]|nr:hypothetical protein [Saprospirales bacterium]
MQTRRRFDMALKKAVHTPEGYRLTVKNAGNLPAPYSISALRAGRPVETVWYPALQGKTAAVAFPDVPADAFVLDYGRAALDINRKNNSRRTSGLLPGLEPLRVRLLAPVEQPARSQLGILPWLGWNNYDKALVGAILYNPPFPARRFQYFLLPGYGIGSKRLAGLADLRFKLLPGGWLPKVLLGLMPRPMITTTTRPTTTTCGFTAWCRCCGFAAERVAVVSSTTCKFRVLFIGKEEARFRLMAFWA